MALGDLIVACVTIVMYLLDCLYRGTQGPQHPVLEVAARSRPGSRCWCKFGVAMVIVPAGVYRAAAVSPTAAHGRGAVAGVHGFQPWLAAWTPGDWILHRRSSPGMIVVTLLWYAPRGGLVHAGLGVRRAAPMLMAVHALVALGVIESMFFSTRYVWTLLGRDSSHGLTLQRRVLARPVDRARRRRRNPVSGDPAATDIATTPEGQVGRGLIRQPAKRRDAGVVLRGDWRAATRRHPRGEARARPGRAGDRRSRPAYRRAVGRLAGPGRRLGSWTSCARAAAAATSTWSSPTATAHAGRWCAARSPRTPPTCRRHCAPTPGTTRGAVGRTTLERLDEMRDGVAFVGRWRTSYGGALPHWRRLRPISVARHVYDTGVTAIPIVALIAFLISVIVAYLRPAAAQLRRRHLRGRPDHGRRAARAGCAAHRHHRRRPHGQRLRGRARLDEAQRRGGRAGCHRRRPGGNAGAAARAGRW